MLNSGGFLAVYVGFEREPSSYVMLSFHILSAVLQGKHFECEVLQVSLPRVDFYRTPHVLRGNSPVQWRSKIGKLCFFVRKWVVALEPDSKVSQ